jgi:nitrate reductase NapD
MNISGILVVVPAEKTADAVEALDALPGVEVHHTDPATGRIVVTQEAESVAAQVEGLSRIKALPQVLMAEMVHHYFGDDIAGSDDASPETGGAAPGRKPEPRRD